MKWKLQGNIKKEDFKIISITSKQANRVIIMCA